MYSEFTENGKYTISKHKHTGHLYVNGIALHRLVYEKHYGKIPKGMIVHHIDFNKENNDIDNLELMTIDEHNKIHHKGLDFKLESRLKESRNKGNKTGFFRVSKNNNGCYTYKYIINGETKSLSSNDINILKNKVLNKGLEWIKL